ncbi:hypothetical protein MOTT16_03430 [Moraxella osloensis]|uniref:Uncharacterized protein n=1 Tax=Faucicola osloensis TaxID=34062 RepID=A0AAD0EXX3_FAUOS|nr:hypothetical protein [Moraxella osloensis]ATQ82954.1 hypothetical protein YHS_03435 [Moraxella osloensis]ATW85454.1 hypothetical protein MOTT16_03430 [Moraxella osloensis]
MITSKTQLDEFFATHSEEIARELMQKSQTWYEKIEDFAGQEFIVPATEKQLNDAIQKFVVEKVKAILAMHLEIHEGWLRLYATVNYNGIFADLAVNLGVVHAQFDRYRQRLVFQQLTDTDVIALYSDSYVKSKAIHVALWFFKRVLKKDPLGMILEKINLVHQKDDILYLDIGRWLKKNEKIMATLRKVQVNHGYLAEQQLLLRANANVGEILNIGSNDQLITEADNPAITANATKAA